MSAKHLPPDTRVQCERRLWVGTVQRYQLLPYNQGWFPVQWSWGGWEICGVDDVTVVTETASRFDAA